MACLLGVDFGTVFPAADVGLTEDWIEYFLGVHVDVKAGEDSDCDENEAAIGFAFCFDGFVDVLADEEAEEVGAALEIGPGFGEHDWE